MNQDDSGMLLAIANEFTPGQEVTQKSLNRMIHMVHHKTDEVEAIAERNSVGVGEVIEFVQKELG